MKTTITTLLFSMLCVLFANSQQIVYRKAAHDLTPFTGTWVGTKDNITYEITFKKGIREVELNDINYTIELVFTSSVKWLKNGILIREFTTNAPKAILEGTVSDSNALLLASVVYYDEEKGYNGEGYFRINAQNLRKAKLYLNSISLGKNRGKMDLPTNMELTKVK
ncbi:DUF6705 family protein [Bacteroides thetaiotaomicron]|uniref:DUF6705 family protein n=1 Tax=Bacteroides thetaiotaomicron TaxID=818 RepID=UPI0032BFC252